MVKSWRSYVLGFKEEAVRLAVGSERTAAEIARELGIQPNLIYRWRKELEEEGDEAFPGQGKLMPSDEEVICIRKELERVRQEQDILKKALIFFAEGSK